MLETPAARLLLGHTVHQRAKPFRHRFRYRLALLDLDVDKLDAAARSSRWFSIDRPNLFSFRRRDHGHRRDEDLRTWAKAQFAEHGIDIGDDTIRLITFPRHLFYKFAPLSLWLAVDADGSLSGVIYEVNNTFGESHAYVAKTSGPGKQRHAANKTFHVSPFFDVTGIYKFTIDWRESGLSLVIESQKSGEQLHVATISAKAARLTSARLLGLAVTRPFSSLFVTLAIHWQALKLWMRGARYRSKPTPPTVQSTPANAEKTGH